MRFYDPASTKALVVTATVVTIALGGLITYFGLRVERAILSIQNPAGVLSLDSEQRSPLVSSPSKTTGDPSGAVPVVSNPKPGPVSAEQFSAQWEGRFAATAEEKCWKPHFKQYEKLPGHLDLSIQVAASGLSQQMQLVGFRNPDDSPHPALAGQVFDCIVTMLKPIQFPPQPEPYVIRGRVNRPNPPPGYQPPHAASAPPMPGEPPQPSDPALLGQRR